MRQCLYMPRRMALHVDLGLACEKAVTAHNLKFG